MHNRLWFAALVVALFITIPATVYAQDEEPMTVSIYHVAPGQHMAFLEWMAEREAIAEAAGVAATQWYVHLNGDSWDFLSVNAPTTDAQDDAIEAAARGQGLTVGGAAGIELRTLIASHTDTDAMGPMTAAEILAAIRGQ